MRRSSQLFDCAVVALGDSSCRVIVVASLAEILKSLAEEEPRPRLSISLTDGNRVSLSNWESADDCLVEYSGKGAPAQLVPLSQIAAIEIPDQD